MHRCPSLAPLDPPHQRVHLQLMPRILQPRPQKTAQSGHTPPAHETTDPPQSHPMPPAPPSTILTTRHLYPLHQIPPRTSSSHPLRFRFEPPPKSSAPLSSNVISSCTFPTTPSTFPQSPKKSSRFVSRPLHKSNAHPSRSYRQHAPARTISHVSGGFLRINSAPRSIGTFHAGSCIVSIRPPTSPRPSNINTCFPSDTSTSAAASLRHPAPTTMTSVFCLP